MTSGRIVTSEGNGGEPERSTSPARPAAGAMVGPGGTVGAPVLIAPPGQRPLFEMRELFEFSGLLFSLTWRDVKVRYKQTVLGVAWAVLQPLATMVVFSVFFGKLGKLNQQSSIPYPLLILCALLPWQFFSNAISTASSSLVVNERLLTKVYFPRIMVPFRSPRSSSALVDSGDLVRVAGPGDDVLRGAPELGRPAAARLPAGSDDRRLGGWPLVVGAQRQISRRALRGPVPDADADVRQPCRLSGQHRPRSRGDRSTA